MKYVDVGDVDVSVCEFFVYTGSDFWSFPGGRGDFILGLGSAVVMCPIPSLTGSPLTLNLCISVQIFSRPSMETNRHAGQSNRHTSNSKIKNSSNS